MPPLRLPGIVLSPPVNASINQTGHIFLEDIPLQLPDHVPDHARERLAEIIERREQNVKYFFNSDLTITAEVYGHSIHYLEEGQWEDIDNSIIEDESDPEQPLNLHCL